MSEINRAEYDRDIYSTPVHNDVCEPDQEVARPRAGQICLRCRKGVLDYDEMLNLVCPNCGLVESGSFT